MHDAVNHPRAGAPRLGARVLEEREVGARPGVLVAVEEVVDAGVVLVDGLGGQPQAEHAGVEVEIAPRVAGDGADVVDAFELHGLPSWAGAGGAALAIVVFSIIAAARATFRSGSGRSKPRRAAEAWGARPRWRRAAPQLRTTPPRPARRPARAARHRRTARRTRASARPETATVARPRSADRAPRWPPPRAPRGAPPPRPTRPGRRSPPAPTRAPAASRPGDPAATGRGVSPS